MFAEIRTTIGQSIFWGPKERKYNLYMFFRNNIVIVNSLHINNGKLITANQVDEKSISIDRLTPLPSAHSIISDVLETGAFQIEDDIPFIDEDSITSLVKPALMNRALSTKVWKHQNDFSFLRKTIAIIP